MGNYVARLKASFSMTTATRAAAFTSGKHLLPLAAVYRRVIMSEVRDTDAVETLSDDDVCYMVFEGSSQEDVAYAKVFWSSLCLQPPIESSLLSVDIRQRLKVAKAPLHNCTTDVPKQPPWSKNNEILQKAYQLQMQDEKQRYLEMAKKHDEIMALLKKQREDRIKKEMVSRLHKPSNPELTERFYCKTPPEVLEQDIKEVRELV